MEYDSEPKVNLPAAQLLLALYSSAGTLDAVDEIVAEWNRDHPEQRDLWERMGVSYLRGAQ